jgi:four helix bundle protein
VATLAKLAATWDKRHVVVDHLLRASESVVLNIAEGNGRCLGADRHKFVEIAESSAVKAATYLDLCERTAEVDSGQRQCGRALLNRVGVLLRGLSGLS